VSRLYAHSKNYDMDLTLDYNVELFPLERDQSFALALASSLARGGVAAAGEADGAEDGDDKDRDVWRPDGKGRRGLEQDYDYVMYGKVSFVFTLHFTLTVNEDKVYKFDGGTSEVVSVHSSFFSLYSSC
jgi:DNA-directed RNA polymerase I, II, and III subunit RPABC3